MVKERLKDFNYLWDGSELGWVLLEVEPDEYCIANTEKGGFLVIEDDDLEQRIVETMLENGISVVRKL